jgi:DNA polymerase elongation subunit (family B)
MFSKKEITSLLFIDIETISPYKTYVEYSKKEPNLAKLFWDKMVKQNKVDEYSNLNMVEECFFKNSSLYPEFSKILTISYGLLKWNKETETYEKSIKNIIDNDEKKVLSRFSTVINKISENYPEFKFCGHNIDGFDIPFLIKRMLINGIELPKKMQIHNLKPWETPTLDTMKLWRFGSFEPTSLDILCNAMGIVSPKSDEVNNKLISEIYYNGTGDNLTTILEYCNKDVDAVMEIIIKISKLG